MRRKNLKIVVCLTLSLILLLGFTLQASADSDVLKKGDKSEKVAYAQKLLKILGFFNEDCTGYFGDITEKAVKAFQKKYDLGVDGIIGPTTMSWLEKQAKAKQNSSTSNRSSNTSRSQQDIIHIVKEGDTLLSIAEDYGISIDDLLKENNLTIDAILQIDQKLKIPKNDEATDSDNSSDSKQIEDTTYGEYLGWFDTVQSLFKKDDVATVTDVDTGKSFKVKRLYGSNHADVEPLTAEDTKIMKSLYESWSWNRRAVIVTINDRRIAGSMNGMPHGNQSIKNNNFGGHFCIHFKGSKTHAGNKVDKTHQEMVKKAAGL